MLAVLTQQPIAHPSACGASAVLCAASCCRESGALQRLGVHTRLLPGLIALGR
jgi:hypothetical protein